MENIETVIGAGAVLGWAIYVIRLMWRYQRDFTNEYAGERDRLEEKIVTMNARHAEELGVLAGRVGALEDEKETLHADLLACVQERGALLAVLDEHGWSRDDDSR